MFNDLIIHLYLNLEKINDYFEKTITVSLAPRLEQENILHQYVNA